MRKIRSFIAAALLLAVFVVSAHNVAGGISLKVTNGRFGFWFNPYKDRSYSILTENITRDTVPVMGSSEFRHGRNSKYHPRSALRNMDTDLVTIGGAGNQILYHSIAAGALADKLERKKIILLISPTWFKPEGVSQVNYGMRFSESEYIRFMENPDIDISTKKYVADRSEKLLMDNATFRNRISIIDGYMLGGKKSSVCGLMFRAEKTLAFDRDRVSSALAVRTLNKKESPDKPAESLTDETFERFMEQAEEDSIAKSNNPLEMSDKSWNRHFKKSYDKEKDAHPKNICSDSPEFDDLRTFLEVCKETGLEAKLVIMPVNGRWYDHVGTGKDKRRATADRILKLADAFNVEAADLTIYDYEPYITKDSNHPWNKGWVLIDKEIYDFCENDREG